MKKAAIIISALTAMFTSCAPSASLSGEWSVLTINGEGVSGAIDTPAITIMGNRYSGKTGVNSINGKVSVKGEKISFGDGAMTRMMGDPESMEIEQRYLDAINAASKAIVNDAGLTLTDKEGREVMTLKKK